MENNQSDRPMSSAALILRLISYVMCFIVPVAILWVLFPQYALWFCLAGMVLLLTISGFLVGIEWDKQGTAEAREQARSLASGISLAFAVLAIYDLVKNREWTGPLLTLASIAVMAILVYLPFLAGRATGRRRESA